MGYKVDQIEKGKNEVAYWRDCGVVWDILAYKFLVNLKGEKWGGFLPQLITGDFNKDGWIDIFNPGIGTFDGVVNDKFQWLIWNPITKIFDNKNLLNDKSLITFGGNQRRTLSIDLNKDGYTDNVIIDHGDDLNFSLPRQPIRIMLSDGKGGYNLQEIKVSDRNDFFHSGDIGDLNNDGLPDLVIGTPNQVIIAWGDNSSSFFGGLKKSIFNAYSPSDNGFGEWFPEISGQSFNITIGDVNKDGWNDLIVGSNEDFTKLNYKFDLTTKVVLNQGNGKFNKDGYIPLPVNWRMKDLRIKNNFLVNDFRIVDIIMMILHSTLICKQVKISFRLTLAYLNTLLIQIDKVVVMVVLGNHGLFIMILMVTVYLMYHILIHTIIGITLYQENLYLLEQVTNILKMISTNMTNMQTVLNQNSPIYEF
jgi:hypothetical protein